MRFLGLDDFEECASAVLHLDLETLVLLQEDRTAAILALRWAGGKPVSDDAMLDCAHGMARLLEGMVTLAPIRQTFGNERVTEAAVRLYALRRGFSLSVSQTHVYELIELVRTRGLGTPEVLHCFKNTLVPSLDILRPSESFDPRGLRMSLSMAITDPSPRLAKVTEQIRQAIEEGAYRRQLELRQPTADQRVSSSGRSFLPRLLTGREPSRPVSTSEIMIASMARLGGADIAVIIQDPQSAGIHVEREWALRLQMPIFEFVFNKEPHPHQDGPNRVHTIEIDQGNPTAAVDRFYELIHEHEWEIADAIALRRAIDLKNATAFEHLRATWSARDVGQREEIKWLSGMSLAYIQGLLTNGRTLELASDFQRTSLELALDLRNDRQRSSVAAPTDREIKLLTDAAGLRRLNPQMLVHAVLIAMQQLRVPHTVNHVLQPDQAELAIGDAVEILRGRFPDENL